METNKTPFTEEEIEELQDLHRGLGQDIIYSKTLEFLKSQGLSNSNSIIVNYRLSVGKFIDQSKKETSEKWKNSTLQDKLHTRLDESGILDK